jgi:type IV secretory pathway VirJ component
MVSFRRVVLGATLCLLTSIAGRDVSTQSASADQASPPGSRQTKSPAPQAKTQPIPAAAANPLTGWDERVLHVPVVGQASVYVPHHPTTSNVVVFMSGDGGWNLGVVDMARRMMPKAIVIGISYVALRKAPGPGVTCWMPSGDIEVIAHDAEKQLNLPAYQPPALVGYSSGATEVYEALAASPYSFAGGLAMGFCPDLPASHSVCASDNFKPPPRDEKKNVVMLPKLPALVRDFYVVNGIQDQVCLPPAMHTFLDDMTNAHFYEAPGTGHGFSRPVRWGPEFDEAFDKLMVSTSAVNHPKRATTTAAPGSAASLEPRLDALKLPLEYEWADRTKAVLVFLSGDGGWMAIDRGVSTYVTTHDVSVIGVNAQSYFWNARTPEQGGADLLRIVDAASALGVPVFVGGYSIGAETVPFMVNTWSEADRHRISGEVLIAPSETASFEFKIVNMLFRAKPTPFVVADAVKAGHVPTFCLAGKAEEPRDTACDNLGTAGDFVTLPGTHHFNSKYDNVGELVMTFIDKHLRSPVTSN